MKQNGPVHRDLWTHLGETVTVPRGTLYTVLLCLTEMTMENGAVQIWPQSATTPTPDPKHGCRALDRMEMQHLTAPAGSCFVFDRFTHSNRYRLKIIFSPLPV